jgi:plasmid stabilization system protein ParE
MRRLVVAPYVLIYRHHGQELEIVSIRHGRQLDPDQPMPNPAAESEEC